MDEAGRGERRSDDALLRDDDHFFDVHHAAPAAAGTVGARAGADALEPDHPADSQAPYAGASAANIRLDGCHAGRSSSAGGGSAASADADARCRFGARPKSGAGCAAFRFGARDLQQVPNPDAHSAYGFARQAVVECPLPEMPEHFYAAAKTGFSGAGFSPSRKRPESFAGVPLRTGKTDGNGGSAIETIRNGDGCIETPCSAGLACCENKIARTAVGSYSPTQAHQVTQKETRG